MLKRIFKWLIQCHNSNPLEDTIKQQTPEEKLAKLLRNVEAAVNRRNNFLKKTIRWASADDYFPMPLSDSETRELRYLERCEINARRAYSDFKIKNFS